VLPLAGRDVEPGEVERLVRAFLGGYDLSCFGRWRRCITRRSRRLGTRRLIDGSCLRRRRRWRGRQRRWWYRWLEVDQVIDLQQWSLAHALVALANFALRGERNESRARVQSDG
jgi:hypothetical protein